MLVSNVAALAGCRHPHMIGAGVFAEPAADDHFHVTIDLDQRAGKAMQPGGERGRAGATEWVEDMAGWRTQQEAYVFQEADGFDAGMCRAVVRAPRLGVIQLGRGPAAAIACPQGAQIECPSAVLA